MGKWISRPPCDTATLPGSKLSTKTGLAQVNTSSSRHSIQNSPRPPAYFTCNHGEFTPSPPCAAASLTPAAICCSTGDFPRVVTRRGESGSAASPAPRPLRLRCCRGERAGWRAARLGDWRWMRMETQAHIRAEGGCHRADEAFCSLLGPRTLGVRGWAARVTSRERLVALPAKR